MTFFESKFNANFETIFPSDFSIKQLITDGASLNRYIKSRHVPIEEEETYRKKRKIQNEIVKGMGYNRVSEIGE